MNEPEITINGNKLTEAQAITIRVAVESFYSDLEDKGLGNDQHGKAMVSLYKERINEIRNIIFNH